MATIRRTKFSFILLFLALSVLAVSAHDASAPTLEEAPPGASSPSAAGSDVGSISSPAGGSDAKSILKDQSHMMGTMDDSTDDNTSGQKRDDGTGAGHHGQCVTSCATKSTEGAGCGKDLSKPDCFCKSQDFIQGTFACINSTCPAQFYGAAGVVTVSNFLPPFILDLLQRCEYTNENFCVLGVVNRVSAVALVLLCKFQAIKVRTTLKTCLLSRMMTGRRMLLMLLPRLAFRQLREAKVQESLRLSLCLFLCRLLRLVVRLRAQERTAVLVAVMAHLLLPVVRGWVEWWLRLPLLLWWLRLAFGLCSNVNTVIYIAFCVSLCIVVLFLVSANSHCSLAIHFYIHHRC